MKISHSQLAKLLAHHRPVVDFIKATHTTCVERSQSTAGHDFSHDLMVAQFGWQISSKKNTGQLAWLAGICHSFDRLTPNYREGDEMVLDPLLDQVGLSPDERTIVLDAIRQHDGPNNNDDHIVKQTLQDADRLANTTVIVIMRTGQYRPNLPAVELEYLDMMNPASTYQRPRSVLDNLRFLLEWEAHPKFCLRIPAAKKIGAQHFRAIRAHIAEIKRDFKRLAIV